VARSAAAAVVLRLGQSSAENRTFGPLTRARPPRQGARVQVFSRTEVIAWIVALFVLEVAHLKWIWLSEWSCRRCKRKNLECACSGRWIRYF
jgi:hypothetical protein